MASLQNRKAFITGASRGIGRAIAEAFAAQGASLGLCATTAERVTDTAARCKELGAPDVRVYGLDVRSSTECDAIVKQAASDLSGIDIVVNNAGVTRDNLLMRLKDEDYDAVMETNMRGTFNVTRAAVRLLMKSGKGRLINVSSIVGIAGNAGQSNYAASKAAVIAFTKSCAKELAGRGVTANVIAPGWIETDLTGALDEKVREAALAAVPLKRLGKPEDVGSVAVFLAGDGASYITAQVIVVDGGLSA